MPISEPIGFFHSMAVPEPRRPDAVSNEPLLPIDLVAIDRYRARSPSFDIAQWHHCIAAVLGERVRVEERFCIECKYGGVLDFDQPRSFLKDMSRLDSAIQLMIHDLIHNKTKTQEAWSWFRLGAELPSLDPYYGRMDDAVIAQGKDLGERIADARRRLL